MDTETTNVTIEKTTYFPPRPDSVSTVYHADGYTEAVTSTARGKNLSTYRRVDKGHFVDLSSGELRAYKSQPNGHPPSPSRSFANLRRLILSNFPPGSHGTMLTLTIGPEHEATLVFIYRCYARFWKRLKYNFQDLEYIAVAEAHKSGRFHLHVLLKCRDGPVPTLDLDKLHVWWGTGSIHARRIYDPPGLCAYLTSARKRSAWQRHYQPYARLYRVSRGIVRPIVEKMSRGELKTYVERHQLTFGHGHTYRIKQISNDGTVRFVTSIIHEFFVSENRSVKRE